jgi:hypothetical protein
MYDFILYQWIMKKFTTDQVNKCVAKGYITQDQANMILATLQIS